MQDKIDYVLLTSSSESQLSRDVSEYLNKGYRLAGAHNVVRGTFTIFSQAVVFYPSESL